MEDDCFEGAGTEASDKKQILLSRPLPFTIYPLPIQGQGLWISSL